MNKICFTYMVLSYDTKLCCEPEATENCDLDLSSPVCDLEGWKLMLAMLPCIPATPRLPQRSA